MLLGYCLNVALRLPVPEDTRQKIVSDSKYNDEAIDIVHTLIVLYTFTAKS